MKLKVIGPNQTELDTGKALVLFSYNTPVAAIIDEVAYKTNKKFSKTTSKHINEWLAGTHPEEKDQSFFDSLT